MNKVKKMFPIVCMTGITIIVCLGLYFKIIAHEKQRCFARLGEYVATFNQEITTKFDDEVGKLRTIGELLSIDGNLDRKQMVSLHIDKLKNSTFYSRIDVLYPNGSFITNGSGSIDGENEDYEKLREMGEHMSHRKTDFVSGKECLYYFIPLSDQNGSSALLIGVIDAQSLDELFVSQIYKGESHYCVVDSYDGNYVMDSWHPSLGNAYDTEERQRVRGYEHIDLKEETKNLNTGVIAFKSATTGRDMYMYYTPLGIYDWQMMLFVEDNVIFKNFNYMKTLLFVTAGAEVIALLFYFFWNLRALGILEQRNAEIKVQREQLKTLSYRDMLTSMFNRNKYIETADRLSGRSLENVGAIYIDMNGLKRINDLKSHTEGDKYICTAADVIKGLFTGQSYRIGGDEFVVLAQPIEKDEFDKKIRNLKEQMEQKGVSVSLGTAFEQKCDNIEALLRTAEQRMYKQKQKYYVDHDRIR